MIKTSILIGGTKGIGSVIAKKLLERGDKLFVISRTKKNKTNYIQSDISSSTDLLNLKKKIKNIKVDNLIFSQRYRGLDNKKDFEIQLEATNNFIKTFKSNLKKNSSIVILSSIATSTVLHDQSDVYHYTRGALEGLVKYYACTLGKKGVRINCIQPSKLLKPENKKFFLKKNNKDRKTLEKITPLGRMGTSEDIANLTSFLTSNYSTFITGVIIPVDGGLRLLSQESIYNMLKK
ncbi:SDR family NAD(P)-dependent oxidoreductase [Candidatus Pelagibacter sp.]|uniref:SDR family NAD(P)-dependent oxidoreductase n=1 Tax=Candidatus Pelagibacter sp. TaxID=2024849 RepID=UPI003F85780D